MRKKLALIGAIAALLSISPAGPLPSAAACPDPDQNPCDIQPWDPPTIPICKIKLTC